tara:strand:- start:17245 stop:17445 length:201 start_codon:yes stop_codon:yes gene_type:complete
LDKITWIYIGQFATVLIILALFLLFYKRLDYLTKSNMDPVHVLNRPKTLIEKMEIRRQAEEDRRYV